MTTCVLRGLLPKLFQSVRIGEHLSNRHAYLQPMLPYAIIMQYLALLKQLILQNCLSPKPIITYPRESSESPGIRFKFLTHNNTNDKQPLITNYEPSL